VNSAAGFARRDHLTDRYADTALRLKFYDHPLDLFWLYVRNEYQ